MPKRVSKIVVVNEKNQVLLLLRGATAPSRSLEWDLPGGVTEAQESPLEGALRELVEESSITASSDQLEFSHTFVSPYSFNTWSIYKLDANNPEVKISWEHTEFIWQPLDQLEQLQNLPEFIRKSIRKAVKNGTIS